MILIVGQEAFIVILRKPVLLYSERQETALIAPELLRKRSSLIVPQIVPHRAHPELLHIRPYSRAAETANKALKALILKRRPPFFARHDDALALFAKPRQKIIVELVAVRYGRKVGIRVDGVNDKAVIGEDDARGEILYLAYIARDIRDGIYYLIPAVYFFAIELARGRDRAAAHLAVFKVSVIIIEKSCILELFVCDIYPQYAGLGIAHFIRLRYDIAVFKGRDELIQALFIIKLALAGIFLKVLRQLVGVFAQKIGLIVIVAVYIHARFADIILAQLVAVLARAPYDIRAAVRRCAVGADDELAALVQKPYEIVVVLAVFAAYGVNGKKGLLLLAFYDVVIHHRQMLAPAYEHSVFRHEVADPFCEAVVKRL